ncbi:MAG: flagellar motor switch protein FliM, partial [Deltaproteobacteria bacterium]|nr:flagellar motor switch protein FliM [Deltaproteobacteria bacterium]
MSQILSQEEVDALLNGVAEGEIETKQPSKEQDDSSSVQAYDLTGQERIVKGRMPALEMVAEGFAKKFRTTLSAVLKKIVGVNKLSVHMARYEEFMKAI